MKKIIRYTITALMMPLTIFLASCEENYLTFDTAYCGIYFTKDTLNYSFGVTPVEVTTYTYNIPVAIMGTTSKEKRTIPYEILPDSTTATEGVHYTIGEAVIMPDSIKGFIPVTVYRNELKGNHIDGYTRYKLCLQLVENTIFTPTLDSLHQVRVFRFDNSVDQPEWYNAHGEKHWQEKDLGKWHPYKLIKMVEYFHAIEAILPETYKKMVDLYGENLEHIPDGDPYQFRTIFIKHIYSPMYEFFNDPDNYEEIKSQFPDFPFGDFPDPYAGA
ncbi:MAG: DUF4843 domain-containing protein [Bacteroidaceae bacterium]|nr:DUF4843 domain-containing protein [Bacteroidaceae bacterium]